MIPNGNASLSDIVGDLDLTTASANLNDVYIRARARKFSGAIGVSDLNGTVAAMMPYMWDGQGATAYKRYLNEWDTYSPKGNIQNYYIQMQADGDAADGVELYVQNYNYQGGDAVVQVVFVGHLPQTSYGQVKMEGTFAPDYDTSLAFMKFEMFGWDAGYFQGNPFQMLVMDSVNTGTDLSSYNSYIETRASNPYITAIAYCVLKSDAPSGDFMSGKVNNFSLSI